MIDLKFLRENPDIVKENIKKKFQDHKLPLVDEVIELDEQARSAQQEAAVVAAPEVSQLVQAQSAPTGDTAPIEWMLLLAALSAAGIGMILAKKRKEN